MHRIRHPGRFFFLGVEATLRGLGGGVTGVPGLVFSICAKIAEEKIMQMQMMPTTMMMGMLSLIRSRLLSLLRSLLGLVMAAMLTMKCMTIN